MSAQPFLNLSPGLHRTGRAAACIWHDSAVLMVGAEGPENTGRWTLPGGSVEPGETPAQAAVREAWEAYLRGSYPIGACVVDTDGAVIVRGRNRLEDVS